MPTVKKWSSFAAATELFRPVRDRYTRRHPLQLHTHEYMELTCIDSGRALHFINGAERTVEPGHLIFIRAADVHSLTPLDQEPLDLTNIAVPMPEFRHLAKRYPAEIERLFRTGEPHGFTLPLDTAQHRAFTLWVNELFEARRDQALAIDRFMLNLMAELLPSPQEISFPPGTPEWLAHAWREIQRPEVFAQGVAGLFRLAARSREHTARELRRYFDITPSQCVRQAQMKYAARELEISTRPILEISLDCGFRDLAHFYKAFKAHHGATPRLYRAAHRIA